MHVVVVICKSFMVRKFFELEFVYAMSMFAFVQAFS